MGPVDLFRILSAAICEIRDSKSNLFSREDPRMAWQTHGYKKCQRRSPLRLYPWDCHAIRGNILLPSALIREVRG